MYFEGITNETGYIASLISLGLQGDDVAKLHQALIALGRDIALSDVDTRVLGPSSTAIVKAIQIDHNLPPTGVVDAKTVEAINPALADQEKADRTVRGRVLTADRVPAPGLNVQVYLQIPGGEKLVGSVALNADGSYQVAYKPNAKLMRHATARRIPATVGSAHSAAALSHHQVPRPVRAKRYAAQARLCSRTRSPWRCHQRRQPRPI